MKIVQPISSEAVTTLVLANKNNPWFCRGVLDAHAEAGGRLNTSDRTRLQTEAALSPDFWAFDFASIMDTFRWP